MDLPGIYCNSRLNAIRIDGRILIQNNQSPPNVPTIASTVRANASAGFSIVTYTATGSPATIGHGLNAAPGFIVVKSRTNSDAWPVYHQALSNPVNQFLGLHSTDAVGSITNYWSGTNSNVIGTLGGYAHSGSGQDYVAYCLDSCRRFQRVWFVHRQWQCRWDLCVYRVPSSLAYDKTH